jgi:collagen type IV alpha-3-binding protein
VVTRPVTPGKEAELARDDISCRLVYAANGKPYAVLDNCTLADVYPISVNPGGWAPAAVVRTIAKRELCKFIKTFSASVQSKVSPTPVTL